MFFGGNAFPKNIGMGFFWLCLRMREQERSALDVDVRPCPSNASVVLGITSLEVRRVRVDIFDMLGRLVKYLGEVDVEPQRTCLVRWEGDDQNGRDVASGIYFARVMYGQRTVAARIVLLR